MLQGFSHEGYEFFIVERVGPGSAGEHAFMRPDEDLRLLHDPFYYRMTGERREFELLKLLAENPGRVFTREELLDKVWGIDFFGDFRTVDVHISKLREKVGEGFIKTVRGVGYKFVLGEQK